jgi:hypothetical protein
MAASPHVSADLAVQYVDHPWVDAPAKHRDSMTDALALVVPVLIKACRGQPSPEVL